MLKKCLFRHSLLFGVSVLGWFRRKFHIFSVCLLNKLVRDRVPGGGDVQVQMCWCTVALAGYLRWVRDFFPLRTHRALEQMEGLGARGLLHSFRLQFSNGDDCACGLGRMTLCLFPVLGINRSPSAFLLVKPRSIDGIVCRTETKYQWKCFLIGTKHNPT